jgi:pimeloyl-ACP methyl ester carboxylesterase
VADAALELRVGRAVEDMQRVLSPAGTTVSYDRYGAGPPLVLVHGAFSDHQTNWEFVRAFFEKGFTVHAVARRGRGETDVTEGHSVADETRDVLTVIEAIGEPVFLLGHSYGAHVSLLAASEAPSRIRTLVLYEPADPRIVATEEALGRLEPFARAGDWDGFAVTFFRDLLSVPGHEVDGVRASELWPPIVADAPASFRDLRALARYDFQADRFRALPFPVVLQIGTESPRHLYVTDALAAAVPHVMVQELPGQAHEGMTTAPEMYAEAVARVLLGPPAA